MSETEETWETCNGTGSNKADLQDLNDGDEVQYQPIQCPDCNGTGKKPS
jgi:DnaJ-class molecular chaperone